MSTVVAYLRLWRELVSACWRRAPVVSTLVSLGMVFHTVSLAAIGVALKLTVDAAAAGRPGGAVVWAIAAAVAIAADQSIGTVAYYLRSHLTEKVGLTEVETAIIRACAGLPEIDHLERTEFLDHITAVRGKAWAIVGSAWTAIAAVSLLLRLVLTLAVLGRVSPWLLLLLLSVVGVQMVLDRRGQAHVRRANLAVAEDLRLQRHLYEVSTSGSAGKEIRVNGAAGELVGRQRAAWNRVQRRRVAGNTAATGWSAAGWVVFVAGLTAAVGLVARQATAGEATVGDVMLTVVISAHLRAVVELAVFTSMDASGSVRVLEPYLWLRRYVAEHRDTGGLPPPARLRDGIDLDDVSFTYPGTEQPAVHRIATHLPAGSVVAIVGEYGSGKTTLVKLLTKLYRPDRGQIRVDGADLARIDTEAWRAAMSAVFQDFGRYQTTFADGVGMGDLTRAGDAGALASAIDAAEGNALVTRLPHGVDTELGTRFGGTELSEGQWQKVALARACMRPRPLLFVLDEPTASLDAPSEHAVFERYLDRSRALATTGAITVIVSHRFSTVAGADLILVMAGGRLVESGTHEQLLARSGLYAELYGAQATAYHARLRPR